MTLRVTVPESYTGDVMSDLNTKRAHVSGMNPGANGTTTIEATVPAAEMQRYATDLRSITQGRGTFTTEFSHYQPVPRAHRGSGQSRGRQASRSGSRVTRDNGSNRPVDGLLGIDPEALSYAALIDLVRELQGALAGTARQMPSQAPRATHASARSAPCLAPITQSSSTAGLLATPERGTAATRSPDRMGLWPRARSSSATT